MTGPTVVAAGLAAAIATAAAALMLHRPAAGAEARFTTLASWYDEGAGKPTAFGEIYRPGGLTAAHRTLPPNTWIEVCRIDRPSRCAVVRVNDRGPDVKTGRGLDVSYGAAIELGMVEQGVVPVSVQLLQPGPPDLLEALRSP